MFLVSGNPVPQVVIDTNAMPRTFNSNMRGEGAGGVTEPIENG